MRASTWLLRLLAICFAWATFTMLTSTLPDPHDSLLRRSLSVDESGSWRDEFEETVHVVTTRFMQRQPSLIALGRARLKLFETFCLPTMSHQTSKRFLWFILIDPDLSTELRHRLIQLVGTYSHVFVIRSNDYTIHLRNGLNESLVETGDVTLLQRAAMQAPSKIMIETSLDADDGLHHNILEMIRQLAIRHLKHTLMYSTSEKHVEQRQQQHSSDWVVFCVNRHFEWHNAGPSAEGLLVFVEKNICVTPGLSFAMGPMADRSDLPGGSHHLLALKLKPCIGTSETACLHRFTELVEPEAIRARTPTSAGMADIGQLNDDNNKANDDRFWDFLDEAFHVKRQDLVEAKAYVRERLPDILRENLAGQCTKGHSCKEESKQKLLELLHTNGKA